MKLAYDRVGAGPTLVLLHPLGADRRVWDPVLDRLSADRDVVAIDLPGFGESPELAGHPSPRALAQAVTAFVKDLGLDGPHLGGNSLGGWVALELALAGHARSVTAIAPAGLWPEPLSTKRGRARRLARVALPLVDRLVSGARGRRLLLSGVMARPEQISAAAARHLVRAYVTAPGFTAANDAMRAGRFEGLEQVRVPVTLVWPAQDRLVRRPKRLAPGPVNLVLENAGHIPMWDAPAEVAQILLDGSAAARELPPAGVKARP